MLSERPSLPEALGDDGTGDAKVRSHAADASRMAAARRSSKIGYLRGQARKKIKQNLVMKPKNICDVLRAKKIFY